MFDVSTLWHVAHIQAIINSCHTQVSMSYVLVEVPHTLGPWHMLALTSPFCVALSYGVCVCGGDNCDAFAKKLSHLLFHFLWGTYFCMNFHSQYWPCETPTITLMHAVYIFLPNAYNALSWNFPDFFCQCAEWCPHFLRSTATTFYQWYHGKILIFIPASVFRKSDFSQNCQDILVE